MAGDPAVLRLQVDVHVRLTRGEDAPMVPRVEPDQLDRGALQRPPHLRLLVSLRIVGQAVTLVEHVERGLDGGGADPERQGPVRIQARLAGERDHLALKAVEAGRDGISRAVEPALEPGRHLRPDQEAGAHVPARGGHHHLPLDPGDGGRAVEDRDLAAQPFERTEPVEVRHCRQGFELDVPPKITAEDVPLGSDPSDTRAQGDRGLGTQATHPAAISARRPAAAESRSGSRRSGLADCPAGRGRPARAPAAWPP